MYLTCLLSAFAALNLGFTVNLILKRAVVICCCALISLGGYSQCELYDGTGAAVANPVWVSCSGGSYTLFIQSPNTFGPLTINWGDGSANTVVASLVPPAFVSRSGIRGRKFARSLHFAASCSTMPTQNVQSPHFPWDTIHSPGPGTTSLRALT